MSLIQTVLLWAFATTGTSPALVLLQVGRPAASAIGGTAGGAPRDPPPPRCKAVAVGCRAKCLGKLNRKDPFPFYKCINECLEAASCPPGMY